MNMFGKSQADYANVVGSIPILATNVVAVKIDACL